MRLAVIALLLVAAPPRGQDDTRIRELIQQLEDDSVEAREGAQKELVRIGEPALALLRKAVEQAGTAGDRGELRVRGEAALRQIDLAVRSRRVYQDPKPVTLQARGMKLSEALASIAKQAGIRIDSSSVDGEAEVSPDLKDAPLFRALDELCRGRDDRSYEYREEGLVKLVKERHVPHPAAYAGPFRIRILTMRTQRSTDFKSKTASLHLTLDADHEKYLKPAKNPDLEISRAADDKGSALEVREGDGEDEMVNAFGGRAFAKIVMAGGGAVIGGADPSAAQKAYTLKGLAAGATRVSIHGTARFRFPLESREIKFEKPETGMNRETSDYTVRLDAQGNRRQWNLSFRRKKAAAGATGTLHEEVEQRLDLESLVAIDEDGAEHKGTFIGSRDTMVAAIRVVNGRVVQDSDSAAFVAQFPTVPLKALKELRFKFSDSTFVKSVPFALEGVELP